MRRRAKGEAGERHDVARLVTFDVGQPLKRPTTSPSVRSAAWASAAAVIKSAFAEEAQECERERRVVARGKRALQRASERFDALGLS